MGKIQIRESGFCEIAANAGVVRHPFSAVTPSNKRAEHRMPDSGTSCARSLIEVTRILMEQRRQYGAADHNVRKIIGHRCAEALTIAIPSLTVVVTISRLSESRHGKNPGSSNRICRHL